MTLADYLAKNYLNADTSIEKKSKKRKRKPGGATDGLLIADDDDDNDEATQWNPRASQNEAEDGPMMGTWSFFFNFPHWECHIFSSMKMLMKGGGGEICLVSGHTSDFRRSKISAWRSVGVPAPSSSEQAAADAIIASTATENAARATREDDDPTVVVADPAAAADLTATTTTTIRTMESGAQAGLQTADQVTAAMQRRLAEEHARFAAEAQTGHGQETIYRDASGRVINIAMKRAEARRQADDAAAKAAAQADAQKGAVQQAQQHDRRQQLHEAKFLPLSRYADDVPLNEHLKQRPRWDDPAANFLSSSSSRRNAGTSNNKPLYQGSYMPNRYGIPPGHRWDGVDRATGFEQRYFAARNRARNRRDLEYAWQVDE